MSEDGDSDSRSCRVEELKYLWDIYKYRHDLCWRTVFKTSFGVIVLSVIPYIPGYRDLASFILLTPPVLGVLLSVFGYWIIRNELDLFWIVIVAHHEAHNDFVDGKFKNEAKYPETERTTLFEWAVNIFMLILIALSALNLVLVGICGIPINVSVANS